MFLPAIRFGRPLIWLSAGLVIVAYAAYNWYDDHVAWPAEIQARVFGRQLVSRHELLEISDSMVLGQGEFVWRYRIDTNSVWLAELCEKQPIGTCTFEKSRVKRGGIYQSGSYSGGLLVLRETWT